MFGTRRIQITLALALLASAAAAFVLSLDGDRAGQGPAKLAYAPANSELSAKQRRQVSERASKLVAITLKSGPTGALQQLEQSQARSGAARLQCHALGHEIGGAALRFYKGDAARAVSAGAAFQACGSGYQHAVLQRAFTDLPIAQLSGSARELCAAAGSDRGPASGCSHGLGHALSERLKVTGLGRALPVCDNTPMAASCRDGIYMGLQFEHGASLKLPCTTVGAAYKRSCYWETGAQATGSIKARAATCSAVENAWIGTCMHAVGAKVAEGGTGTEMVKACAAAGPHAAQCVLGALRYVLIVPPRSPELAREICSSSTYAAACTKHAGAVLASIQTPAADAERTCHQIAAPQAGGCISESLRPIEAWDSAAVAARAATAL